MEGMEESDRPAFPPKPILHIQAVWFGVWHLPSLSPTVLTFIYLFFHLFLLVGG